MMIDILDLSRTSRTNKMSLALFILKGTDQMFLLPMAPALIIHFIINAPRTPLMELGGTWLEVKVKKETRNDLQRKHQRLSKGQDIKCL